MINRWEPGRADINAQLTAGYLQKVKPDRRLSGQNRIYTAKWRRIHHLSDVRMKNGLLRRRSLEAC